MKHSSPYATSPIKRHRSTSTISFPGFDEPEGSRKVNDPIHGFITLPKELWRFVDTPQFQRLRDLKQLGTTYLVFPGASHNRFEHSIGVCHLAEQQLRRLAELPDSPEVTKRDLHLVSLAGLLHDLGHGPFSHAFEEWMHSRLGHSWSHENMSKQMFRYAIDSNHIDNYEVNDIHMVEDLISPKNPDANSPRAFLHEIVSNPWSGIDVDKFDYLVRDGYNLGLKSSYDASRLMNSSRIVDGHICYNEKAVFDVYSMFHARYTLHKQVYSHRVTKALEYMLGDAFTSADSFMKISEQSQAPETFTYVSDSLVQRIEASKEPELADARAILLRFRRRDLYKFVDEVICDKQFFSSRDEKEVARAICSFNDLLREDDIIVQKTQLHYGMKDVNPVDSVRFYSNSQSKEWFYIPKEKVSMLIPTQFSENLLRVFVRDPRKASLAREAFRGFLGERGLESSYTHPASQQETPQRVPMARRTLSRLGTPPRMPTSLYDVDAVTPLTTPTDDKK